jgi:hypothetical protein
MVFSKRGDTMVLLEQTGQALVNPIINLWNSFVNVIPGLIGAIIVLVIGYIVGWVIGFVLTKILHKAKLDRLVVEKTTLDKIMGKFELSHFLGLIVKWYVFVLFLGPAAALVRLPALTSFLNSAALWIPSLIAAVIVALVGLIAADYVAAKVTEVKAKSSGIIANTLKLVIVVFTLIIALSQLGVDVSIAENTVLIIIAGIMLALGIGFGLAFKDEAKAIIKDVKKKL